MDREFAWRHPVPFSERITTFCHFNNAATIWSSRNVASVTENGVADTTITFRTAYQATPAAILGAGEATNLYPQISDLTTASIRVLTKNSSSTATVGRKTSVALVGSL